MIIILNKEVKILNYCRKVSHSKNKKLIRHYLAVCLTIFITLSISLISVSFQDKNHYIDRSPSAATADDPAPMMDNISRESRYGEIYFELAMVNLHFYMAQFKVKYFSKLNPEQQRMWNGLELVLQWNNYRNATGQSHIVLKPGTSPSMFITDKPGTPPRLAATLPYELDPKLQDPIWINPELFPTETTQEIFNYARAVQVLVHEFGHKVPRENKEATNDIAKILFTEIQNATLFKVINGNRFEFVVVSSDQLANLGKDQQPLQRDEVVLFMRNPKGTQLSFLTNLVTTKTIALATHQVFLKFDRFVGENIEPQLYRIPFSYKTIVAPQKGLQLWGPLAQLQQTFSSEIRLRADGLSFTIQNGYQVNLSYKAKVLSVMQSPNQLDIVVNVDGSKLNENLKSAQMILKVGANEFTMDLIDIKKIDNNRSEMHFQISNVRSDLDVPVMVESLRLDMNSAQPVKIFLDEPVLWSNRIVRKTNKISVSEGRKPYTAELALLPSLAQFFGSNESPAFVIKIGQVGQNDIHSIDFILNVEMFLPKLNQKLKIPYLQVQAVNSKNFKYDEKNKQAYLLLPVHDFFSLNFVEHLQYDGFRFEESDIEISLELVSGRIVGKDLKNKSVSVTDKYKMTLTGVSTFRETNKLGLICQDLF